MHVVDESLQRAHDFAPRNMKRFYTTFGSHITGSNALILPILFDVEVTHGHLCIKGHLGFEFPKPGTEGLTVTQLLTRSRGKAGQMILKSPIFLAYP